MSLHSIKKATQLRVNEKPVKKLGKKARTRDAGVQIGDMQPVDSQTAPRPVAGPRKAPPRPSKESGAKLATKSNRKSKSKSKSKTKTKSKSKSKSKSNEPGI